MNPWDIIGWIVLVSMALILGIVLLDFLIFWREEKEVESRQNKWK